jgi:hypothetical protein
MNLTAAYHREFDAHEDQDKDPGAKFLSHLAMNDIDDDPTLAPQDFTITLTDGSQVEIIEADCEGMAGEPMTYLVGYKPGDDRTRIWIRDIEHLMTEEDRELISQWQNSISNSNQDSAIAWTI